MTNGSMTKTMTNAANGSNTTPLQCLCCKGEPKYSDMSHLLTHLASKGHLSQKNVLEKRAPIDVDAQATLVRFTAWYQRHNLAFLERQRLEQKDAKKLGVANGSTSGSKSSRRVSATSHATSTTRKAPNPYPNMGRSQALRGDSIDPQLDGPRIKTEPKSRSGTPNLPLAFDLAAMSRSYVPPMTNHTNSPYHMSPNMTSVLDSVNTSSSSDPSYGEIESNTTVRKRKHTGSVSTLGVPELDRDSEFANIGGVTTVVPKTKKDTRLNIPGVHQIDCASSEGKRMRNQKKSKSVLINLEATSKEIVPEELVWKNAHLRANRMITGHPTSDPLDTSGETEPEPEVPPPKRTRNLRKPRTALTRKSVNTGMVMMDTPGSHQASYNTAKIQTPYYNDSSEADYDLTYGYGAPKAQGGIRIHNDNTGPAITFSNSSMRQMSNQIPNHMQNHVSSQMSSQMSTLTSEFQQVTQMAPYQQRAQTSYQAMPTWGSQYPLPSFLNSTMPRQMTSNNGHVSGPQPNFGSFGQLNGFSVTNTFGGPNPLAYDGDTTGAAPTTLQETGMGNQSYGGDANLLPAPGMTGMQNLAGFDAFSAEELDLGLPEAGFDIDADFNAGEDLFFGEAGEDDGATISVATSEL